MPTKTSGLAIASLVLGIASILIFPLGVVAIVLGAVAISQIKQPDSRVRGKILAMVGMGLATFTVVFGVLSLTLLAPALERARQAAYRTASASEMQKIYLSMKSYADANRRQFPVDPSVLVRQGSVELEQFIHPGSGNELPAAVESAVVAEDWDKVSAWIQKDSDYVYVYPNRGAESADAVIMHEKQRPQSIGINILFGDGRILWKETAEAESILKKQGRPVRLARSNSNSTVRPKTSHRVRPAPTRPLPKPTPPKVSTPTRQYSKVVGGSGGGKFELVGDGLRPMVGVAYKSMKWGGDHAFNKLEPLHDLNATTQYTRVSAKPGYVVGKVEFASDDYVRGVRLVFMRFSGGKLNAADQYQSDWIGKHQGFTKTILGVDGKPILGFYGNKGLVLDAAGVVQAR